MSLTHNAPTSLVDRLSKANIYPSIPNPNTNLRAPDRRTKRMLTAVEYAGGKAPPTNLYSTHASAAVVSNTCTRNVSWNGYRTPRKSTASSAKPPFASQSCILLTCHILYRLEYLYSTFSCILHEIWRLGYDSVWLLRCGSDVSLLSSGRFGDYSFGLVMEAGQHNI